MTAVSRGRPLAHAGAVNDEAGIKMLLQRTRKHARGTRDEIAREKYQRKCGELELTESKQNQLSQKRLGALKGRVRSINAAKAFDKARSRRLRRRNVAEKKESQHIPDDMITAPGCAW